jgi:hypothetical protein
MQEWRTEKKLPAKSLSFTFVVHPSVIETPLTVFKKEQKKREEVNFETEYYSCAPLTEWHIYT